LQSAPSVERAAPEQEADSEAQITQRLLEQNPGEVLTFTVAEAEELGYSFELRSSLEVCSLDSGFQGFDSPQAAAEGALTADDYPECALDRSNIQSFTIGLAEPTSNHDTSPYHHSGQVTGAYNFKGAEGTFKVKDITDLAHPGTGEQFVVDRLLVKKQANPSACQKPTDGDRWTEVGWSEHSNNTNARLIYTWSTEDCAWSTYFPALTDGQFYVFRARQYQSGIRTAILSGTTWVVLQDYDQPDCVPSQGEAVCAVEDYVEVFSTVTGNHPDWSGTIGNMDLQLWKANDNWIPWGNSIQTITGDVAPYKRCGVSNFDSFTVEKTAASC
jgi:hypothetical protein